MKPYIIMLISLFYIGCECCRPDIKLGDKTLEPVTRSFLPDSADSVRTYTNQRLDTLKLKSVYSRFASFIIAVDYLCNKGFDSQMKYWNCEYIHYQFALDSVIFYGNVTARTDRLPIDTMLVDIISVSLNGLDMNKIPSMRNMDTTHLDPDDYSWLKYMNNANDTDYITLNGKTFRDVFYTIVADTAYVWNPLSCLELYYAKGTGIAGFKLKNGDFWVLDE